MPTVGPTISALHDAVQEHVGGEERGGAGVEVGDAVQEERRDRVVRVLDQLAPGDGLDEVEQLRGRGGQQDDPADQLEQPVDPLPDHADEEDEVQHGQGSVRRPGLLLGHRPTSWSSVRAPALSG